MGGFARVNGVSYDVGGGFTKISGVNYDISGGRTLVGGVQRDISFGPAIDPVFANNDWATIIYACQSRQVPDTWKVRDQKPMTIGTETYNIDIIGRDHDTYSDGSGTAPLTFQMHEKTTNKMRFASDTSGNNGIWKDCYLRMTGIPEFMTLMPAEVQNAIRLVDKQSVISVTASWYSTTLNYGITQDTLFPLSAIECWHNNNATGVTTSEGNRYEYYGSYRPLGKLKLDGSDRYWGLRSSKNGSTRYVVDFDDDYNSVRLTERSATMSDPEAFAFCF